MSNMLDNTESANAGIENQDMRLIHDQYWRLWLGAGAFIVADDLAATAGRATIGIESLAVVTFYGADGYIFTGADFGPWLFTSMLDSRAYY